MSEHLKKFEYAPRRKSLAYIARCAKEISDRPLYAGVVQHKLTTHYGEGGTISLPLVRWLDKKRPT